MMQQVASLKPESAASSLPLDISKQAESNSTFSDVFAQQSTPTAYEQARQRSQNSAFNQRQQINENNQQASKSQAQDDIQSEQLASQNERNNRHLSELEADNANTESVQEDSSASTKAQERSLTQNERAEHYSQSQKNISRDEGEDFSTSVENKEKIAQVYVTETNQEDDFDYITYVTDLAEFSGDASGVLNDHKQLKREPSDVNHDLQNGDKEKLVELSVALGDLNTKDKESSEFMTMSLSKQELQSILDAQNLELDMQAQLSENQLSQNQLGHKEIGKLNEIINNMLGQLEQHKNGQESAESASINEQDRALLNNLLLNNTNSNQSKTDFESTADLDPDAMTKTKDAESALIEQELAAKIQAESEDLASTLNGIGQAQLAAQTSTQAATQANQSDKLAVSKENSKADILSLNEEQTKLALNNLTQRVQSIVAELSNDNKSGEFIAALQSGFKEFKQQVEQGREPGIDLKALVNEALATAKVTVEEGSTAKIDNAVTQFNSVLNLANAVNHSASQQLSQSMGINETQFTREINQQQIEGTKLANTQNNNLSSQVNDKAINMFKADGQQQLTEKVRWMIGSKNLSAEIRLDPPDLGGMNIKINMSGESAQVSFTVQSLIAKEALDHAAPRLREMLQQQGIELGQSSVQQESREQQQGDPNSELAQQSGHGNNNMSSESLVDSDELNAHVIEQRISGSHIGAIDYFA